MVPISLPDPTEVRLRHLESENRALKRRCDYLQWCGLACVALLLGIGYLNRVERSEPRDYKVPERPDAIVAHQFNLVDGMGNVRASLKLQAGGQPALSMVGHNGLGLMLGLLGSAGNPETAMLKFSRNKSEESLFLSLNPGGPTVGLIGREDRPSIVLGVTEVATLLSINQSKNKAYSYIGMDKEGYSFLDFENSSTGCSRSLTNRPPLVP